VIEFCISRRVSRRRVISARATQCHGARIENEDVLIESSTTVDDWLARLPLVQVYWLKIKKKIFFFKIWISVFICFYLFECCRSTCARHIGDRSYLPIRSPPRLYYNSYVPRYCVHYAIAILVHEWFLHLHFLLGSGFQKNYISNARVSAGKLWENSVTMYIRFVIQKTCM